MSRRSSHLEPVPDEPALPRYRRDLKATQELANALMDLPDEFLACRDMRHAWKVMHDFHVTDGGKRIREILRVLVCERCGTERHEVYHLTRAGMEKVRSHYVYPEREDGTKYQIKGVPRGVKPQSVVQGEQYRRALERVAGRARGA